MHGDAPQFPNNWGNPSHDQLPDLVRNNGQLPLRLRRRLVQHLNALRSFREDADYRPGRTVDDEIALECLQRATESLDRAEVDDRTPDKAPVRLLVEDDSVHRTEYSWRVRVRPSREPRRWSYLYEELGLVSEKIAEMTGLNVLFTADDPVEAELAIA